MRSLDKIPSLALEYDKWGSLELVNSRSGLNAHARVVPDFVNLGGPIRTLRGSSSEPLISRAVAG
jgi:hypothetical protein